MIFLLGLIYFPSYKPKDYSDFSLSTKGRIERVEPNNVWIQDFEGSSEVTVSLTVYYTYIVNHQTYSAKTILVNKEAHSPYIKIIENYIGRDDFPIKYKPKHPDKSVLDIYAFD